MDIVGKKLQFIAEIRKVESKKLVTNDMEYRLLLNTDDSTVMDLGKLPAETLLKVTVEVSD